VASDANRKYSPVVALPVLITNRQSMARTNALDGRPATRVSGICALQAWCSRRSSGYKVAWIERVCQ
jgi:hypothetical protein